MTPAIQLSSEFREYSSRLTRLHNLIRVNCDESPEGDLLRDEMDVYWCKLSDVEAKLASGLSEDLYASSLSLTPIKQPLGSPSRWLKSLRAQMQSALSSFAASIRPHPIVRHEESVLSGEFSTANGIAWASQGEWLVAKSFFVDAYRRNPDHPTFAILLLNAALQSEASADDISLAFEIGERQTNPIALHFAALVSEPPFAAFRASSQQAEQVNLIANKSYRYIAVSSGMRDSSRRSKFAIRSGLLLAINYAALNDQASAIRQAQEVISHHSLEMSFQISSMLNAISHSQFDEQKHRKFLSQILRTSVFELDLANAPATNVWLFDEQ